MARWTSLGILILWVTIAGCAQYVSDFRAPPATDEEPVAMNRAWIPYSTGYRLFAPYHLASTLGEEGRLWIAALRNARPESEKRERKERLEVQFRDRYVSLSRQREEAIFRRLQANDNRSRAEALAEERSLEETTARYVRDLRLWVAAPETDILDSGAANETVLDLLRPQEDGTWHPERYPLVDAKSIAIAPGGQGRPVIVVATKDRLVAWKPDSAIPDDSEIIARGEFQEIRLTGSNGVVYLAARPAEGNEIALFTWTRALGWQQKPPLSEDNSELAEGLVLDENGENLYLAFKDGPLLLARYHIGLGRWRVFPATKEGMSVWRGSTLMPRSDGGLCVAFQEQTPGEYDYKDVLHCSQGSTPTLFEFRFEAGRHRTQLMGWPLAQMSQCIAMAGSRDGTSGVQTKCLPGTHAGWEQSAGLELHTGGHAWLVSAHSFEETAYLPFVACEREGRFCSLFVAQSLATEGPDSFVEMARSSAREPEALADLDDRNSRVVLQSNTGCYSYQGEHEMADGAWFIKVSDSVGSHGWVDSQALRQVERCKGQGAE